MQTLVTIIGAGPSGLILSQILDQNGVDNVVLERRDRAYVESRIRAGVLEMSTANLLCRAGVGSRMQTEGQVHEGFYLAFNGEMRRVDMKAAVGGSVIVYGQTEIQRDLFDACENRGGKIFFNVSDLCIEGADTKTPRVAFTKDGQRLEIASEFVAGCDGFHGVSRQTIPTANRTEFERVYPYGWLGLLADTPPVEDELVYVNHERGFALCSMRSKNRSRYYLQVSDQENAADWSDDAFWRELKLRLPAEQVAKLVTGKSIEKSIAQLRSFICEPLRYGRLFLAGDAGHIVPPTGAKGLNLAASDIYYLSEALLEYFSSGSELALDHYSARALKRIWNAERFSWWFSRLTHRFSKDPFDLRMQTTELDYFTQSDAGQKVLAENYVGLPY